MWPAPINDDEVREYLRKILRKQAGDGSGLIYGIGHAVYTLSDPRAQILKEHARLLAYDKGFDREYELLCAIERLAPRCLPRSTTAPRRSAPTWTCSAADLRMLGISEDLYTQLFAIARVPGWCAHRVEEVLFANRIIRPRLQVRGQSPALRYAGEPPRPRISELTFSNNKYRNPAGAICACRISIFRILMEGYEKCPPYG